MYEQMNELDKVLDGEYYRYLPGKRTIQLDGHFTVEQLKFIVECMESYKN
jgi:hypothetical protein